ncbi:glycine cleavage H-protein-domain-containing protein [Lineolata rhizophorae]|uniref:Glycine cleavage system H protein n=1 Tax=Lineolata rhizophorae TaxID=578093 RepID=A0A6A6NPH3_9PEZI|nr:glycine cleavage H-protein-domain-containing protein [Lineolata rhizophorae]
MAARVSIARAARSLASSAAPPRQLRSSGLLCCGNGAAWQRSAMRAAALEKTSLRQELRRGFAASATAREKKYTEDHEWIELEASGKIGTLGITTYASSALGDVVFIELPELGLEVNAGDAIGAVESVKSASDILTPVGGTIVEANGALEDKPANVNRDPEGEAWIARIEVRDAKELDGLMGKEEYEKFTSE